MDSRDRAKFDALWHAIEEGDTEAFEDELKGTPQAVLEMAVSPEHGHSAAMPLDEGGQPPSRVPPTLLTHALVVGEAPMVELLLSAGCSPFARGAQTEPPLLLAIQSGELAKVKALLRHGAHQERWLVNEMGAIGHALAQGQFQMAWEIMDARGDLPGLHRSIMNGDANADFGNVGVVDESGATALHWAACSGDCEAIGALVDRGADVDGLQHDRPNSLSHGERRGQPGCSPSADAAWRRPADQ